MVFKSGDVIGGFAIAALGIDRNYHVSDNGMHLIQELLMDTGSSTHDGFLYVDGSLVARELDPIGDGTNWDNFDLVSVNDAGHYLVSGDSSGAVETDEFIAHDLAIKLRQGDVVDGQTLAGTVRGVWINNLDQAAWSWTTGAGEGVFFSCLAADIDTASTLLLSTGDGIDVDTDGIADGTLTDINLQDSGGNGLRLSETGAVYVPADVNLAAAPWLRS